MRPSLLITPLFCCAFLLSACFEAPPSFRVVELAEAQRLVHAGRVIVVDVVSGEKAALPLVRGGVQWRLQDGVPPEPPPLAAGDVLVLGTEPEPTYRAAAALARARNPSVYVLISSSADERGTLYALEPQIPPQREEKPRGRDS